MTELPRGEKLKIYEKEKTRIEIQNLDERIDLRQKKRRNSIIISSIIFSIFLSAYILLRNDTLPPALPSQPTIPEDKSSEIASFIESKVNTGGFSGCSARSIGRQLVRVDMMFPAGTDRSTVQATTLGAANRLAQMGRLASTIVYDGWSGSQKICEYKYDMNTATVK
jgi:hypothetical protein